MIVVLCTPFKKHACLANNMVWSVLLILLFTLNGVQEMEESVWRSAETMGGQQGWMNPCGL
jgi:hypothetical protein